MSKPKTAAAAQSAAVSFVLKKPHTHAGRKYLPGELITVTADQRSWLTSLGVIGQKEESSHV
jgi:hypothetical protein